MSFIDNKITTADLNGKGVMGLPDAPQLSAEEMQRKFDEVGKEVIVPKFNELCEALDANVPPIILPEAPVTPQDGDMLVYDAELGAFVFVQKATTLANLKDVDLTGLVNGMYLRYDFPTRRWKATNSSASVPALDDINDVSITNATDGQCLIYNDGTWKNDNEKLDDLKNVYIHLPQNKQLLAYDAANDRWTNVELDGGGHKILNASGTQLAQEEYLQFGGLLKATDENGKTVVTDEAEEISFADWDALTEEQREAYSAGKKLNILDPPDCDGTLEIDFMKDAWTNPNPAQAFPATESDRTITLNTDGNYDKVLLIMGFNTSYPDYQCSFIFEKGKNGFASTSSTKASGSHMSLLKRNVTYVSDTQLSIGNCEYIDEAGNYSATANTNLIPLKVYVFKDNPSVKVTTIATNVSTLASNCLMSDEQTSVEEAISNSGYTVTANSSLGSITYSHIAKLNNKLLVDVVFASTANSTSGQAIFSIKKDGNAISCDTQNVFGHRLQNDGNSAYCPVTAAGVVSAGPSYPIASSKIYHFNFILNLS